MLTMISEWNARSDVWNSRGTSEMLTRRRIPSDTEAELSGYADATRFCFYILDIEGAYLQLSSRV